MGLGIKKIKADMHGDTSRWGKRAEAKKRSKKARRLEDKKQ